MNRRFRSALAGLVVVVAAAAAALPAAGGGRDLAVVRPGGVSASAEAQTQVGRLIAELARRAGWPEGAGRATYYSDAEAALAAIRGERPGFLLTTPGFYLAHRAELGLRPLNQLVIEGRTTHRYFVVARKQGGPDSPAALRGRTLAGAPLAEPLFVERIVLARQLAFGGEVTVQPMRGLTALRRLSAGELDAVLLDEKEHAALADLPFAAELATIYSSPPVPNTGLMALAGTADPADAAALVRAAADLAAGDEGRAICETYGITGFAPVDEPALARLAEDYDRP